MGGWEEKGGAGRRGLGREGRKRMEGQAAGGGGLRGEGSGPREDGKIRDKRDVEGLRIKRREGRAAGAGP